MQDIPLKLILNSNLVQSNFPIIYGDKSAHHDNACRFQLSSVQQVLATQLSDGMMYPIGRFLQADLDGKEIGVNWLMVA